MKRFRYLLDLRVLVAIGAIAIGIAAYTANVPTSSAVAGPAVCSFYSNATYKKVVGARGTGCCGSVVEWGITTQWVKCQQLLCPDVVCPD